MALILVQHRNHSSFLCIYNYILKKWKILAYFNRCTYLYVTNLSSLLLTSPSRLMPSLPCLNRHPPLGHHFSSLPPQQKCPPYPMVGRCCPHAHILISRVELLPPWPTSKTPSPSAPILSGSDALLSPCRLFHEDALTAPSGSDTHSGSVIHTDTLIMYLRPQTPC